MKRVFQVLTLSVLLGTAAGLAAQTTSPGRPELTRNDASIKAAVVHKLAAKREFHDVQTAVEDGIVTLSGSVDIYQQKLNAAKDARKLANVQGVRNLITVVGNNVSDSDLAVQLDRKLYYDRLAQDNLFNYVTASVENGVATLSGETRDAYDRDSALDLVDSTPGVKDVINNIKVAPASLSDDQIRRSAERAIYGNSALGQYAIDPARPIRIVVDRGHLALYGTVASAMDKQVAGIKANQVFGAFSVQNNLEVAKKG
jgi:osmotically-inducible protein OsmY